MLFFLSFPDYLLIFLGFFNAMLAFFILSNDPKNSINIVFTTFALSLSAWIFLLLTFRNAPLEVASVYMRAIYVSGLFIAMNVWFFVHVFPHKRSNVLNYNIGSFVLFIIVSYLLFIPDFIVGDAFILPDGTRSVDLKPIGWWLFTAFFSAYYLGGLILFALSLKDTNEVLRKQAKIIFATMIGIVLCGGYFNIILPSPFFHNYHFIHLGPVFTFILVLTVSYSIAKYQLMSMKALLTELAVVAMVILFGIDVLFVDTLTQLILKGSAFVLAAGLGYVIVRSVVREVNQKEQIEHMAKSLEVANEKLQELDRTKTEFLSIASHQLRTPLSIIKGYIELISDGAFGKVTKKTKGILDEMDESNERLVKLVDEFLDITRIEQGRTKFSFAKGSMNEVITSCYKELIDRASQKGLKIDWKPSKTASVKVMMDSEKIRHVVFNFIDNAIKYSDKGVIKIILEKKSGKVVVRVKDEGFGFNKEDKGNFFQKFYRGKNVEGTNVNGTGLGIYVCRKFIEAHGGQVWAKSPGLGKGSEFGFEVPLEGPDEQTVEFKDEQAKFGQDIINQYSDRPEELSSDTKE
ncbi:HAMP domain-containing histidine kinase [Candidatus Nomurabacteria bacterium]|nr:HAMP domain-containing histidine kinase [Candidatus Nomurabacteria bacterium]